MYFRKPESYNKKEQRKVMSHVLEIAICETFKQTYYKWNGKVRCQRIGGATGLKWIGFLSKVLMDIWIERYRARDKGETPEIYMWMMSWLYAITYI